eukprot:GFUD01025435.1.p1 GENE.GFUD01025435.1~~GFUD01025435.1.p1  ORF type:complete len:409 (-),score=91.97 GFUD01025435.1:38-1264(-)
MFAARMGVLTWQQISNLVKNSRKEVDLVNGPTNSQATLRLFGQPESGVRVTLFRDHHAWCPYCQKVWLWLEEKRVPYRIRKVTMFCYGEKEAWYKKICPSGMLPAIQLDNEIITESDDILWALETQFGPLDRSLQDSQVVSLRKLERKLFSAWCQWLCYPARNKEEENSAKNNFEKVAKSVDKALEMTPGPFFLANFSVADCVFIPYVERMNASLFYYKGFTLRDPAKYPHLSAWFDGIETRETYRGTQSDSHTHVHDLPPQMGGCYPNGEEQQKANQAAVDSGLDFTLPDAGFAEPETSRNIALEKVLKHKDNIIKINPCNDDVIDGGLRCALTYMMTGEMETPPPGADSGLRYLRDRVNVPRDMPLWSARRLRESLELTAERAGTGQGPDITLKHRKDQNPKYFGK